MQIVRDVLEDVGCIQELPQVLETNSTCAPPKFQPVCQKLCTQLFAELGPEKPVSITKVIDKTTQHARAAISHKWLGIAAAVPDVDSSGLGPLAIC